MRHHNGKFSGSSTTNIYWVPAVCLGYWDYCFPGGYILVWETRYLYMKKLSQYKVVYKCQSGQLLHFLVSLYVIQSLIFVCCVILSVSPVYMYVSALLSNLHMQVTRFVPVALPKCHTQLTAAMEVGSCFLWGWGAVLSACLWPLFTSQQKDSRSFSLTFLQKLVGQKCSFWNHSLNMLSCSY